MNKRTVVLTILDGYGLSDNPVGNAVLAAKKPNLDAIFSQYPHTTLGASGFDVGLPEGQMGNSEVGHINIGAGRIVYQSLTRLDLAVKNDTLIEMPAIKQAITNALKNKGKIHIMGLASDGGVHSHLKHILYLMEKCVASGVKEVIVHAFLDGRDVPPQSAMIYLSQIDAHAKKIGRAKIGVVSGRYYAMDRDHNYQRLQLAYDALVYNRAPKKDLAEGIIESYAANVTDEFVIPYIVSDDSMINDNDSVIFANFRPDRAIEISTALTNLSASGIENGKVFHNLTFVSMMLYSETVKGLVVFDNQELIDIFGDVVSRAGKRQLRIAETEKYAHVTYFFDGGIDREYPGATRILVPSPKIATYDLLPEMSAYEVCEKTVLAIKSNIYDVIILNFANCDMVGHTCDFNATVKAVETVDACVGMVYRAIKETNGIMLITADHGNAEKLLDENNNPFSAHTTNPVPFIITKKDVTLRNDGNLGDIAPTMLALMEIDQPIAMTGKNLIKK